MKIFISIITLLLSMLAFGEYRYDSLLTEGAADLSEMLQRSDGGEPHDDEPEDDEPEGDDPEDDEPEDDGSDD